MRVAAPWLTAKVSALRSAIQSVSAGRDILIIFAAQRRHIPFVGGAAVEIGRVQGAGLLVGQLVPAAQIDLLDARIGGVALRRQPQHAARDLHGGAGAPERRGNAGDGGLGAKLALQHLADLMRLFAAAARSAACLSCPKNAFPDWPRSGHGAQNKA